MLATGVYVNGFGHQRCDNTMTECPVLAEAVEKVGWWVALEFA
jgi:hypothetical protein